LIGLADVNVLIYAANQGSDRHQAASSWLRRALRGPAPVLLPWASLLGFARIVTHRRIMPNPLTTAQAMDLIDRWLGSPAGRAVEPARGHATIVKGLLDAAGQAGNLVPDAHLAALAIENHAEVITFDTDFALFPQVRWRPPG
jgi:toxin-antitoxin system PIN domain toxin